MIWSLIISKEASLAFTWKAFWKVAIEQKSGKEAATELGISTGAAYIAKSRVIARLSQEIAAIDGEPDFSAKVA